MFEEEASSEVTKFINEVRLAQEFPGWTLDYIRTLDPFEVAKIWGVIDGQNKVKKARENEKGKK